MHDVMNRVTWVPNGAGRHTDYVYDADGNVVTVTNRKGDASAYAHDAAGRLLSSTKRTGATNLSQRASFNDANQLTGSETSERGRGVSAGTASYSYDAAGNRVNQTVAGVSARFAYNPAGQTTEVAREGRTTSYGYDGLGRNTSVTDQTRYRLQRWPLRFSDRRAWFSGVSRRVSMWIVS